MSSAPPVKISANIPADTFEQLKWLAGERGTTMTEVLRRAVEHETYFQQQTDKGGKILEEDSKGNIRQVLIR